MLGAICLVRLLLMSLSLAAMAQEPGKWSESVKPTRQRLLHDAEETKAAE